MTLSVVKRRPFYVRRSVAKGFKPVVRRPALSNNMQKLQRMVEEAEKAHTELRHTLAEFEKHRPDNPEAEKLLKRLLGE